MRQHQLPWEDITGPCAHLRQLVPLARLALDMPQANPLTLAMTTKILAQHGLLAHAPPRRDTASSC